MIKKDSYITVDSTKARSGILDFLEALQTIFLPLFLAWTDTKSRYKRSFLGPLWLVLTTGISVIGLGFVWSTIFHVSPGDLIPSLAIGLIFWQFISGCVVEAPSVFVRNSLIIKNMRTSTFTLNFHLVLRHIINLAHNFIIIFIILLIYRHHISYNLLLIVPGFLLVLSNMVCFVHIIGFLGARYRDLEPLIISTMPIIFFLTPVIYKTSQVASMKIFMMCNPFYHWISLVRDPLLGTRPSFYNYLFGIVFAIIGSYFSIKLTTYKKYRLAYWI